MNDLDSTARFALRGAPEDHIRWLLPKLDEDLTYRRWLDTEMIAFPGEPKRRCDTVAELVSRSGEQPPWALVLEVEARPRAVLLDRLLEYQCRVLRRLRHGPRRRDRYLVAGLAIVLMGRQPKLQLSMRLPRTKLGMRWKAGAINLPRRDATKFLGRIEKGELGRGVLPWVPLMNGGGEPAVVAQWRRLAELEPDTQRRKDWAGLVRVFAEWAGCLPVWKQTLEEVDMWKSQVLEEARVQGGVKQLQTGILRLYRLRFQAEPPADLVAMVEQTADLNLLGSWLDAVGTAVTAEAFRAQLPATSGRPTN